MSAETEYLNFYITVGYVKDAELIEIIRVELALRESGKARKLERGEWDKLYSHTQRELIELRASGVWEKYAEGNSLPYIYTPFVPLQVSRGNQRIFREAGAAFRMKPGEWNRLYEHTRRELIEQRCKGLWEPSFGQVGERRRNH